MLLKAIKMQVETRLESSLHNRVYIIPEQDKNPAQVEHPWSIEVKAGSKPKVRLPQNTHIITVFDQQGIDGRLLILGKPGAGKTTMLLELAQKLVQRAQKDLNEPIPILLSLTSWKNNHQSIKDWIIAELNSGKYYKVRPDITKQWLEDGEIIPLLDGLDELAAERQENCVQKLNEFLQPGNWSYPLVVCSRIDEYQLYSAQLALNNSVELQPFTTEQIQDYLKRTGNHQLGDNIRDDQTLRELAQTPLLLNIIVLSFQKISLDTWQELDNSKKRLNHLFSAYVEVMLERVCEVKRPSDEKTQTWLSWLARKLIEQNETEFFIEKMQPNWLENRRQKQIYRLIYGLIWGLFSGLESSEIETKTGSNQGIWKSLQHAVIFGLSVGLFFGLFLERSVGLFFGLSVGLTAGGDACIKHLCLRLILCHKDYIPWNYARFLNYATNRLFLQRVGGGYRFVHDLLRQHFADNYR